MALNQTEISKLYVSIFGRASEGEGNKYWQSYSDDLTEVADAMLNTTASHDYFGETLNDNEAFIEFIYENTLGKTKEDDPEGIAFWTNKLDEGATKGEVVAALVSAVETYKDTTDETTKKAYDQFMNKVAVSDYCAENQEKFTGDYEIFKSFVDEVDSNPESAESVKNKIKTFAETHKNDAETTKDEMKNDAENAKDDAEKTKDELKDEAESMRDTLKSDAEADRDKLKDDAENAKDDVLTQPIGEVEKIDGPLGGVAKGSGQTTETTVEAEDDDSDSSDSSDSDSEAGEGSVSVSSDFFNAYVFENSYSSEYVVDTDVDSSVDLVGVVDSSDDMFIA